MRRRNRQAGQALYVAAASLVVLLGFIGLGVDMGMLRYEKRLEQTAADAAALAGANNLEYNAGAGMTPAALAAAQTNGFGATGTYCASGCPNAGDVGYVTVTVNNPPLSGPHQAGTTNASNYVEAIVSVVQPTYFMKIFGVNSEVVAARAVATNLAGTPNGGLACIYTLGAPQKKIESGVNVSGSVIVQAPTCGIMDNGNLIGNGGSNLSVTAGSIGVSGSFTNNGTGTITPNPVTGVPAVGDPIQATAPCSGTGCSGSLGPVKITSGSCSGAGCTGVSCSGGTCTINPGTYDNICIDNNQTVNFSDGGSSTGGLFILTGASVCSTGVEFNVNAGSTLCNSTNLNCSGMTGSANNGVTFYMTGSGSVSINGNSTVQLTAPNSGAYEGLLFYQDPSDTASATISGNNNSLYQGTLYFPSAQLTFGGNNTTCNTSPCTFNGGAAYTFIVSSWLTFAGNPTIEINSDISGLGGNGGPLAGLLTSARLVE